MKFEPQCKTIADLHREWARVLDMCEGTVVKPECTQKCVGGGITTHDDPSLSGTPEFYEFPIAIVEGKLVWRGDELYYGSRKYVATGRENRLVWLDGDSTGGSANPDELSWNPPRKTITINGEQIIAPLKTFYDDNGEGDFDAILSFNSAKERDAFKNSLESRPPKM